MFSVLQIPNWAKTIHCCCVLKSAPAALFWLNKTNIKYVTFNLVIKLVVLKQCQNINHNIKSAELWHKSFCSLSVYNLSCLLVSVIPKVRLIDFMAHIIVDRTHSGVDITCLFFFSLRNNCVIFYYFSSEFWMLVDFQIYRCLWCRSQCRNDKQSNILLLQKYYLSSRLTDKNTIQMHKNILSI